MPRMVACEHLNEGASYRPDVSTGGEPSEKERGRKKRREKTQYLIYPFDGSMRKVFYIGSRGIVPVVVVVKAGKLGLSER